MAKRDPATDYLQNMFKDGKNRTGHNKKAHNAPGYDAAAHTVSKDVGEDRVRSVAVPRDTFHSRDGTDAAGDYDEDGGSLGGTERELDELEATGTPVDRNPRMKG